MMTDVTAAPRRSYTIAAVIAAHCDACCWVCSNTIRTARSRIWGENRLRLTNDPVPQGTEPPTNPRPFGFVSRMGVMLIRRTTLPSAATNAHAVASRAINRQSL